MQKENKLNFNEGTINFWVPKGKIDYKDNKFVQLYYYSNGDDTIKIIKDKDNGLKVYYLFEGNKCLLSTKVEDLEDDNKHMVTVTWSLPEKKVKLYIDAVLRDECEIEVSPF